jgi:fructoselysine 3-epimerase
VKLAFNTWVYSSFPVWVPAYPLEVAIERIAAIGYDGIEIGAASPHAFPDYVSKERRREIKAALKANGIALASMLPAPGGGPGFNVASPIREEREGAIDQYRKVIQLCSDWGGATCIYIAGWQIFGTEREAAWEWSRAALVDIAAFAKDSGITIVIEPTSADSNLVDSIDDALRMMTESDAANVKVMFDTYHALYRNEVSSDYVYRAGKNLHHVHIADIDRNPPGDGRVDYVALIAALKAVRFKGYLTMEIGFNRRGVEPDDFARRAYEYLKPLVK